MDYLCNFKKGFFVLTTAALFGCGSEDGSSGVSPDFNGVQYEGKSTSAVINTDNKMVLAESSARNVAYQIDASDEVDIRMPASVNELQVDPKTLWDLLKDTRNIESDNLRNVQGSGYKREVMEMQTESGSCGGSVTFEGSEYKWTATFADYCERDSSAIAYADSYETTINGSMSYSMDGNTETYIYESLRYSARYGDDRFESGTTSGMIQTIYLNDLSYADYTEKFNITITRNGETIQIAGEETCTDYFNCTSADYYSEGDKVYKVEIISEFYEYFDGTFSGSMTLYDPDHGYITVSARDMLPCESGFSSGSITVTDQSAGEMKIDYNGCGQDVTLMLNGNAEIASL